MSKPVKESTRKGFSFRHPGGHLDYRVVNTVEAAQSNAAFASTTRCGISPPSDWNAAYKLGFRVVPVKLTAGPTHKAWKPYQKFKS